LSGVLRKFQEKFTEPDGFVLTNPEKDEDSPIVELREGIWYAGRYIGQCWIDNKYHIQIEPRFGKDLDFLLMLLEDVYNIKLRNSTNDGASQQKWDELMRLVLYTLWVFKFARADRYGLPRKTVQRTCQGNKIRGHLNLRQSVKTLFTRREVVSQYYERDYDDSMCKIIYHAYRLLRKRKAQFPISQMPKNVEESIHQLDAHYRQQDLTVSPRDYQSIIYKDIYVSWKPLVDFSWQIVQQERLGSQAASMQGQSVFIDMAEIWEQFLRKTLADAFKTDGWRCWSRDEAAIKTYQGRFYQRTIIPDIVLQRGNDIMVFDAKYKRMTGRNDDIDRADFFQIHTYIQYFKAMGKHVVCGGLLYPLTGENPPVEDQYYSLNLFGTDDGTKFIVDGIVCNNEGLQASKEAFIERIKNYLKKSWSNS